MPWFAIVGIVIRRWWVFAAVFVICIAGSLQIRAIGAEYIALSEITVVAPPSENPLLDSHDPAYLATAIVAVLEQYDDGYHGELEADGLSSDFSIDIFTTFPVMGLEVKAPTYDNARLSAERIASDLVDRIDSVQAERDVAEVARLSGGVLEIVQFPPRPAGSNRGLAGLGLASMMIAGAAAYGADQFVFPWYASVQRRRKARAALVRA